MKPPNELNSQTLGILEYDSIDGDILGLIKKVNLPAGSIAICFPDLDHERSMDDWLSIISKFDAAYAFLFPRIEKAKEEALSSVIDLHREYFPDDTNTPEQNKIWDILKLRKIIYYGDGSIGLRYPESEYFHCLDLNIELNTEWLIEEVSLDG